MNILRAVTLVLVLSVPCLAFHAAPAFVRWVTRDADVGESHGAVVRRVREGLAIFESRYGPAAPDSSWGEVDRQIYESLAAALEREGP